MDILLGKYEIQTFKYIDERQYIDERKQASSANSIISHLLGGGLTILLYLIFLALAANFKY